MRAKTLIAALAIWVAALIAACGGSSSGEGKVIKSTNADGITIALLSPTGELRSGDNELTLSFTDASGKPVEMSAASLNFHMPAMGSMAEMNDQATLTTTSTPGKFHARVQIEMPGTWEAQINYQGPRGSGRATMTVIAK
jgi:nitrogen fixation protein FixH